MTNNFKILHDFDFKINSNEIKKKIEKIEKDILENNLDYVFHDGRNVLELILQNEYEDIANLESIIQDLRMHRALPSKVTNALYAIKQKGNEGSHSTMKKSDKPYATKVDLFSTVEFLKQLFIIIKYFISELNSDIWAEGDTETYQFISDIYLPKMSAEKEMVNYDISPDTASLESDLKGIFELINSDYNFLIPTYQRDYSWSEEQINVFLQDIWDRSVDKKTHYMGSLAIALDQKNKFLRLIDGQQRITTSLLLIKAMIEKFKNTKSLSMPKELLNLKDKLSKKYINASSDYGEMSYVKKILSNYFSFSSSDKSFKASNSYKNYLQITNFLDNLKAEEFDKFYLSFVYEFVISELRFKNDLGNEIQIFENLNSKGMELSQWDLIKNYIYRNVKIEFLIENEQTVEQLIKELFVIKSSHYFGTKAYMKEISDFFVIHCRIASKLLNDKPLNDKGKIHKVFSTLWPRNDGKKFESIADLRASLLEISKQFEIYGIIKSKEFLKPDNPLFYMRLHLENMSMKDAHLPLVINSIMLVSEWDGLNLEKIKKEDKEKVHTLISDIDKYITRMIVVSNIGQSLSSTFDRVISNDLIKTHSIFLGTISERGKSISLPSYKNFKDELKDKNDWQPEYALAVMRTLNYDYSSDISKRYEIVFKSSLEHIFPQKPSDESSWFQNANLSTSRFKDKKDTKINKLGNFLILSQSLNSKAKNYDFKTKLKHYSSDKKTIQMSGLPGELMNLLIKNSFTFDDIDERTKQLAELISPKYKLSNEK